jgi:hypothetical protein
MTTSIQNQPLSLPTQFQQLFSSVGSILTSLCEKTDSAFRRVHVMKRDENGNTRLFDVRDGHTSTTSERRQTAVITYVEDIKTGEMTLDEPHYVISFKCFLIALGMPFYAFGKMAWYTFKTPFEITAIATQAIIEAGRQFGYGRFYQGFAELRKRISISSEKLGYGLVEIVKAPLFGLGGVLAALYGVVKPYHGRKIEAIIERAWQNGASYKEDLRQVPARPGENCWEAFVKDVIDAHPFYLAHCFQVRGNIRDANIVVVQRSPL